MCACHSIASSFKNNEFGLMLAQILKEDDVSTIDIMQDLKSLRNSHPSSPRPPRTHVKPLYASVQLSRTFV